jgi:thymidine kinase
MQGSLEVIIGKHGSGVTSSLREKYSPLQATNKTPFIIFVHKNTFESANENTKKIYVNSKAKIVSSVDEIFSEIKAYKIEKNNEDRISEVSQYQQIFIDGINNFVDLRLIALLESAAYNGKKVIAAGNSFLEDSGLPYPIMPALIAKADDVIVLSESENLEIITGCMFSSKSQKLARKLNSLRSQNYNVLAFKHSLDSERFKEKKTFIRGQSDDPYGFEAYTVSNISEIGEIIKEFEKNGRIDYIGIDEINFFQEKELVNANLNMPEEALNLIISKKNSDLDHLSPYEVVGERIYLKKPKIQTLIEELLGKNIKVIVSGLDTDYRGEPWEWFTLLCSNNKIIKLTAQCSEEGCLNQATKTMRLTYDEQLKNYKPSSYNEPTVQVGTNIEFQKHIYTPKCREHHRVEYDESFSKLNPKQIFQF